jgi:hypothetical protein
MEYIVEFPEDIRRVEALRIGDYEVLSPRRIRTFVEKRSGVAYVFVPFGFYQANGEIEVDVQFPFVLRVQWDNYFEVRAHMVMRPERNQSSLQLLFPIVVGHDYGVLHTK